MSAHEYLNFDLLIESAANGYRTRVLDAPAGEATGAFTLPFAADELRSWLTLAEDKLRHLRLAPAVQATQSSLTPRQFGERLFDAVFADDIGVCLLRSLDEAKRRKAGLRIRLRLDKDAPVLAELPWEYLYARSLQRFLALSDETALVRYLELPQPPAPLPVTPPLHILAVVANPANAPPLQVEQEWTRLTEALARVQTQGLVKLERLADATVAALQTRLRQDDIHVLHFIGHGYFDANTEEGGLLFADDQGQPHPVAAQRLGALLHDQVNLRLVFLNACVGAQTGSQNSLAGTAQQLVQQGIPAVLAMQAVVSDRAAITLAQTFYSAVADGYPVDAVVAEARKAVYLADNEWEWATPVLFSRSPDNRLFALPRPSTDQRLLADRRVRIAIPGLIALFVCLALVWANWGKLHPAAPTQPLCPQDRQCLLVADFDPATDELAVEITRKIRAALANETLLAPNAFAVQPVAAITEAGQARQLTDREHALILVWGQVFRQFQELNIHFELTDQFGIAESHVLRPDRVQFFDEITQQVVCKGPCFADLSTVRAVLDQLSTVIAYTAAGLLHYAAQQPETAQQDFLAALYCSGEKIDLAAFPDLSPNCAAHSPIEGFNPAPIYYYAGKAQLLTGDYGAAIGLLQKAAAQNAKDPAALIGIAIAYRSWLDRADVITATQALNEAKARINALRADRVALPTAKHDLAAIDYELGLIAELAGDWTTAQQKYQEATDGFGRTDPAAYVTLLALGRAQQMTKQGDAAATFQSASALDKQAPWAWLALAQLYRADRPKATQQLVQAHQVAPNEPYVDIVETELCTSWQDDGCAKAAYERALEKRPRSGWLYGRIGDFYRPSNPLLTHQNWPQAAQYYEQAAQWRPRDPWTHERLAFADFQLGKYADAAQHFAVSLNDLSHPESRKPERYCTLGQAQQRAKLLKVAAANYHTCLNGLVDPKQRTLVQGWIADIEATQAK